MSCPRCGAGAPVPPGGGAGQGAAGPPGDIAGSGPAVAGQLAPQSEIPATCEIHGGSGRLVVRGEGDRIVLDAYADHCCVITLENPAVTRLFGALGEWLG
jgi:hypothetical protein